MAISSITRLAKTEKKTPTDLRQVAEALYLKLHVAGFQAKQKVAVIAHMIGMVTDGYEADRAQRRQEN
jgi:phenylacetate-coenzyme A ligase PaaK-like adenylate-forming protein